MSAETRKRVSLACELSLLALLVTLALSLSGVGCEKKTTAVTPYAPANIDPAAAELLSASVGKMIETASYRTASVSELTSNTVVDEMMPGLALIECELVDGTWNKKLTSDLGMEDAQEAYIIGGAIYVKIEGEWYCRKDPVNAMKRDLVDLATPESIHLAVDNADEVSLVSEDASSATCRLRLRKRYYDAVVAELEKVAADLGTKSSARQVKEMKESLPLMDMQVDISIDKQTGLFSRMVISMSMEDPSNPDMPALRMTAEVETTFSDYGKDFDISLPEGAENARLVPVSN